MFEGPANLIQNSKNITLLTHKDAGKDGDALGSLLSLTLFCSKIERENHPFLSDKIASNFLFLPGVDMLDKKFNEQTDLLIFLDCAEYKHGDFDKRVYNLIEKVPSILIDHHPKGDLSHFVKFQIHDLSAASTTELIYFLLTSFKANIDKDIATALLTGILTDTSRFQNPNTTKKTFFVSSCLLSRGVRMDEIINHVFYMKSQGVLKLWGRALLRLYKNQKYNLLISYLTENDLKGSEIGKEEIDGIANFLNLNAKGDASAILFLLGFDGKIKGSLRTTKDNIDVSRLARFLGGGGHQKAAGFEIEGKLKIENQEFIIE